MNNNPSNNNKRATVKPPRNNEVVRQHDESINNMTSDFNANHNSDNDLQELFVYESKVRK